MLLFVILCLSFRKPFSCKINFFIVPLGYNGKSEEKKKYVSGNADRWVLSGGHLHDISDAIFDLLFTICLLADYTKNKLRDRIEEYCL